MNYQPSYRLHLLLLVGIVSCTSEIKPSSNTHINFAPESQVIKGRVERLVVVDGNLYSPSSKPLSIQRIRWYWDYNISWTADEGSTVQAGDPIIKLDPSTIQKDLDEKELSLAQQKLELEEEELRAADEIADAVAAVKTAEFEVKKEKLLLTDSDAVSEAEKKKQRLKVQAAEATLRRNQEKIESARQRSKRKIESQKIRVKKAEEEVGEMREGLGRTVLNAPQDGLVIFPLYSSNAGWQKARPGAGVQANTLVAEIADPKDLVARIFVPEIDADGIADSTVGTMTLDILSGANFSGAVRKVASVPSTPAERDGNKSPKPSDNVRQFEVLFEISDLPTEAMPGMTVQVTLRPVAKDQVVRVPIEALTTAPLTDDGRAQPFAGGNEAYIYMRPKSGQARDWQWRRITLGIQSLTHAEVLTGIDEGDFYRSVLW